MAGTINSLGIGSGVLTADLIDKLKENERSASITPIESKITLTEQKQEVMGMLSSLTSTFKSSVSALSDDTLYQERTVTGSTDEVSVSAAKGTGLQSFSITDVSLATKNVQQSGVFSSTSDTIATGAGSLTISINGENFSIDYDAMTTLDDLKESIRSSTANDKLTTSILQVGENEFTLTLTSNSTGKDQSITLSDNSGNLDASLLSASQKSGVFTTANDLIAGASTSGNVQIDINGVTADIAYDENTTLTQLKDMINSDTTLSGIVSATIVEEGTSDFKLILTPIGAQAGQAVTITDSSTGLDTNLTTGSTSIAGTLSEVQSAADASFKYNGISITRNSNTIDDIIIGVDIKLLKDGGSTNINITQDRQPIITELATFVSSYNTLQGQLAKMTQADLEEGTVGVFSGDSTIRGIGREITKIITSVSQDGSSLSQFGIGLNQDGTMTFSQADFNVQMDADPDNVEALFSGSSSIDLNDNSTYTEGVFELLNDKLDSYTKANGLFSLLTDGLRTEFNSFQSQHERTLALLEARYDTMTQRFIAYDSIINRLNSQSSALTQQIDMAIAAQKG